MKENIKYFGIGLGASLTGIAEYLVYRPWGNGKGTLIDLPIRLIDKSKGIENYLHSIPNYFGNIHGWMPDYLGTIGGSFLAIILSNSKTKAMKYGIIGMITGINLLGQMCQYFKYIPGTYDTNDIFAYLGGAVTAAVIVRTTTKKSILEDKLKK